MVAIKFFESMDFLEPKCPHCEAKLDYGVNTRFDKEKDSEICNNCGNEI